MTGTANDIIELHSRQKLLIRRLYHEDKAYSMAILEVGHDNRLSISPFITETASTIFIDSAMKLVTPKIGQPYLITQSKPE